MILNTVLSMVYITVCFFMLLDTKKALSVKTHEELRHITLMLVDSMRDDQLQ